MRLIVCGPRHGVDPSVVDSAMWKIVDDLYEGETLIVIHGANFDRPDSADHLVAAWCKSKEIPTEEFPADWARYGNGAGPRRNREMADAGADLCQAFGRLCNCGNRLGPHMTHGTSSMVNEALRADIEVRIVPL